RSNSRFSELDTLLKIKLDNPASRAKGETGIKKIVDYDGKTKLVTYTPLKILGLNWSLHAKIDWNETISGMQFMLLWSIFIVGIGIIIVISIAILFSDSIINPIKAITDAANKLTNGHMTVSLDINRNDEIGQLATVFQQMANDIAKIIEDIVQVSHGLAKGNLNVVTKGEYHGDFAQIKQSLEEAVSSLSAVINDIVSVSRGLADGDLAVVPQAKEYHGDVIQIRTALTIALSNQRKVIEDIVHVSEELLLGEFNYTSGTEYKGDFAKIEGVLATLSSNLRFLVTDIVHVSQDLAAGKEIAPQSEYAGSFTEVKTALENASLQLVKATEKNSLQDWLKTGQNNLNDQMSGEQNIVELTHNAVSFLTLYLDSQIGLCYLVEKSTNLNPIKLIASYAHNRRKNIADEFEFIKGLAERTVKEQKTISIEIASNLSDAIPKYVTLMPFLYENTVKGVILLGNSKKLTNIQLEFIDQVMPTIGIAVNSVEARNKMQELLQQTQNQAQELGQQQEELQHNNEELKSQSEELQDQTEELQSQSEELRQSNESLEERTRELEQQKQEITDKNTTLIKVKQDIETKAREIELASKYKSEFLANMSHELRTPLNSLLILAQLLVDNKGKNLTDKQVEYARTIHNSGIDLLRLINDILDLSKVEAGKIEINIEDVLLTDLVMNIEKEFRPVAENKGLGFQITIADDIPQILDTDGQRLKQIINNLLSNAFKFTSNGEVKMTIRHPSRHNDIVKYKSSETIVIGVTDTGIGIPKEKQESIFAAFQQADGTTSRNYGGTGLGLSISRQLANLLGGELELRSEEGKGSSFTLYLPQKVEESDFIKYQDTDSKTFSDISNSDMSNVFMDDRDNLTNDEKSLLIIEDDTSFVNILLETARDKDFKCLVADNGETGLQLAEQYQPDAIILDVGLPKVDGLTVMERLKDNQNTKDILVHFISASELSNDAMGMAIGYLRKPVDMEQLFTVFGQIEQLITKPVKNLLIISDSEPHKQQILDLIKNDDIKVTQAMTIDDTLHCIQTKVYDCVILDMDIEHHSSTKLIKRMHDAPDSCKTPVIIYAEQKLTQDEEILLQKCTDNLVLKSSRSSTRLLDEATLFLHQLEAKLPEGKQD
ncbi:ATP-binding protein, partial [Thiotrichales bacterium HSG1]|nr:ATP-binding protein [Thiotrichales bacterium HSG1]